LSLIVYGRTDIKFLKIRLMVDARWQGRKWLLHCSCTKCKYFSIGLILAFYITNIVCRNLFHKINWTNFQTNATNININENILPSYVENVLGIRKYKILLLDRNPFSLRRSCIWYVRLSSAQIVICMPNILLFSLFRHIYYF